MSKSSRRAAMRRERQRKNAEALTKEQIALHPYPAAQFIVFGGKHGNHKEWRSFEWFVARFAMMGA